MYLFLRGMCGPDTPVVDGHPAGVFSWQPPAVVGGRAVGSAGRGEGGERDPRRSSRREVLEPADVHVAQRLTALAREDDERVALAVAMTVRALRGGSVCVELRSVAEQVGVAGLPWPDPDEWMAAVEASTLRGTPEVLRVHDGLLYFDRYWREEQQVAEDLLAMLPTRDAEAKPDVARLFPPGFEEQREAAEIALSQGLTVLTGGPGTGKTTTVARLLALFAEQAEMVGQSRLRIALAAPTGKAAARLQEAVQLEVDRLDVVDQERLAGLQATTLHRLLGWRPDSSSRFRHHRGNRLPHDVIVVDETSMVSLTMMARLLEAVRPETRLLLVGDPDQLASVEAGAVLADVVDGLGSRRRADRGAADVAPVRRVDRRVGGGDPGGRRRPSHRGAAGRRRAHRVGRHRPAVAAPAEIGCPACASAAEAAMLGDEEAALETLDEHRLLCAHRRGPYGVPHWNRQVERWLVEETGEPIWSPWYAGPAGAGDGERLRSEAVQR